MEFRLIFKIHEKPYSSKDKGKFKIFNLNAKKVVAKKGDLNYTISNRHS